MPRLQLPDTNVIAYGDAPQGTALPEYGGAFCDPFFDLMRLVAPVFAIAAIPYFLYVDRRMAEPRDGYWLAGQLVSGNGWVVAIVCYPPFWTLIEGQYLNFAGPESWETWLAGSPLLHGLWGAGLLALIVFYAWSSVAFGLRFSNLTHRGIITGGPYALTRHPAYISKNLFWWLSAMPFVTANGWEVAVKGCLLLAAVNAIYLVRARTEERHLSQDPVYVAYAGWIRQHGAIARLAAAASRRPAPPCRRAGEAPDLLERGCFGSNRQ